MLRNASADDVDVIADLTVQAYLDGGHMPPGSAYIATLRDVEPRLEQTVVLEMDNVTVASIAALPHGHAMAEATQPGEWEFRYLAVSHDRWGSGLGRQLVSAVEGRARRAGAESMVLRVVDHNPRAMRLYEHLGYQHLADRDVAFESSSFPGQMIRLLLYAKKL